jgi:outer membrane protein TolC
MRLLVVMLVVLGVGGCSRTFYRLQADRETYGIIDERNQDPRWSLPRTSLDVPPESRLFDPFDPDHPPMPPDDPAADEYMQRVFGMRGYRKWHRDGDASWVEDPEWRQYLQLDKEGNLILTPEKAVAVGLLNSRDYQTQLENLYLSSLSVTLDRFQFELQFFGTNDTVFTHSGSSANEQNTLSTGTQVGFNRALATGGQFMAEFANAFVFQYAGKDTTIGFSNLIFTFTQPILQYAGRAVALETLTEAERTLLYGVRSFAHFRKQFTFQVATSGYLNLLTQEQAVRNQQANLDSLEENLRLHKALYETGKVSSVKVDQVNLSLQQAKASLVQAQTFLEASQDAYKQLLGLPPNMPIRLDNSVLSPFELVDPDLTKLQAEAKDLKIQFRKITEAPADLMRTNLKKLEIFRTRAARLVEEIGREMDRWKKTPAAASLDRGIGVRAEESLAELTQKLGGVRDEIEDLRKKIAEAGLAKARGPQGTEVLVRLIGATEGIAAELFVIQTRVRVFLIQLKRVNYELADATEYALANRLDLMNQQAQVVDAWRQVTVTASALKTGLTLTGAANIGTPPLGNRALDFRSSASVYTAGVHIDTPLNRLAQRNTYRASLISYQQARRAYMALEDSVREDIRSDIRQLRLNRVNFEIARQSLISAAVQYQSASEEILLPNADPTSTLNILNALNAVLAAKNTLIGSWVSYETTRYRLLLDMEALQLDERGLYTDVNDDRSAAGTAGSLAGTTILPIVP